MYRNGCIIAQETEGTTMVLTKSEMQIMDVLWAADGPMSRAGILAASDEKSWKDSSVHILLNGLLKKGAIYEAGSVKCSKTIGRTFAPSLTREEYFAVNAFSYTHKPDAVGLITALVKRAELTDDQKAQLRELLK